MTLPPTKDTSSPPLGFRHHPGCGHAQWLPRPTTSPAIRYPSTHAGDISTSLLTKPPQIHLYGGHRPEDGDFEPIIDNYYILSIPQFVWTRAPSIPKPRTLARCDLLGTHRMVITGGARQIGVDCSTLIKILDLSTGQAINSFNDNANYTVPSYVVSDIGGG